MLSAGRWCKFTYIHIHGDSITRHIVSIISRGVLMVFVFNFCLNFEDVRTTKKSVRSVRSV